MARETVVLAGCVPSPHLALDHLVAEFGWSFQEASSLCNLRELSAGHLVVAVLFSPRSLELPWDRALRGIQDAAPKSLPILCHGFSDSIDWPQVAEAGGFHSLLLPFNLHEVRQSLAFVWDAKHRPAGALFHPPRHRKTASRTTRLAPAARIVT